MSAHFFESWNAWMKVIPFAVLGASLLGSGHCVAMCGGLMVTVTRDRKSVLRYHLGRLLGYCGLGALAGFLGEAVLRSSVFAIVPWVSSALMAAGFTVLGIRLWTGRSMHLFRLPGAFWRRLDRVGAGATGLLSVFLPCGWLHVFVMGALATRSASLGAFYLFVFWLGTLPALSAAPLAARRLLQPMTRRAPRASAVILIAIGFASLGMRLVPVLSPTPAGAQGGGHCHSASDAAGFRLSRGMKQAQEENKK